MGVAVLGRTILGDYGDDLPQLSTPMIELVTVADDAEEDDDGEEETELTQLAAPVIYLETAVVTLEQLPTPEIYLTEE